MVGEFQGDLPECFFGTDESVHHVRVEVASSALTWSTTGDGSLGAPVTDCQKPSG